ncbi:MAG: nuclease family protein [Sphingobacteriaceae bacterium]|jgi:putative endonuclease|nr:nuclease family protein [Sphingobacteriaceae bacterium]
MWNYNYYVYIITNPGKTVLYTGVTNNLKERLWQHQQNQGTKGTFAGKYHCHHLLWYEHHSDINNAIAREKEIKGWRRQKKIDLIESENPNWNFIVYEG